jgi:hypothetical protein
VAAKREYITVFSIGAKLLGSFRGTMVAANARLKTLERSAKAAGRAIKAIFIGATALTGLGGLFAIFGTFRKLFEGASDAAIEANHRERELTTALMKNNEIRAHGIEFAQRQNAMIYKQAEALGKVGVISEEMYKGAAVTLAEIGVPTDSIIKSIGPMGDLVAQLKGAKATQEDLIGLANAMGRAINVGQLRPLRAYIKDLTKGDQDQFKALKTRQEQWNFLINRMKFAAGANIREGNTAEGIQRKLQNRIEQLRIEIGQRLLPIQAKMAEMWLKILDPKGGVEPAILKTLDLLGKAITWATTEAGEFMKAAGKEGLWKTLSDLAKQTGDLLKVLWELATALFGVDPATDDATKGMTTLGKIVHWVNEELKADVHTIKVLVHWLKELRKVIPTADEYNILKPSKSMGPSPLLRSMMGGAARSYYGGRGGGGHVMLGGHGTGAGSTWDVAKAAGDTAAGAAPGAMPTPLPTPVAGAAAVAGAVKGGIPAGAIPTANAMYSAAIAAGASPTNAAFLVGAAYQESGFKPRLTGDNNTSFGVMQVGAGLWNKMVAAGLADDPVGQLKYYMNHVPRSTWERMNKAGSITEAFDALHANQNWKLGAATRPGSLRYGQQFMGAAPPPAAVEAAQAQTNVAQVGPLGAPGLQFGGIVRGLTHAFLGERGPEAVIPLRGGGRAEALLSYANRALGMGGMFGGGGGGRTHLNFTPNITIHGNASETEQRAMDTRLRDLARDFIAQFKAAQYHERRLSYESGYQ